MSIVLFINYSMLIFYFIEQMNKINVNNETIILNVLFPFHDEYLKY